MRENRGNSSMLKNLGQVFTSIKVAQIMVTLLEPHLTSNSRCLDPCIGNNIFLSELSKHQKYFEMVGIELDRSLISNEISEFYKREERKIIIDDFFNFPVEEKFDIIIMNPPYVRQELLIGAKNSKDAIFQKLRAHYPSIPKRSNLYVYFLLKALKHLKNNGVLVAIIYDSWLFTDYGKAFIEMIRKESSLDKIIHFRAGAFEKISVGATIIQISNSPQKPTCDYYLFSSPSEADVGDPLPEEKQKQLSIDNILDIHSAYMGSINFSSDIFTPISKLSDTDIKRGTSALINKYFFVKKEEFEGFTERVVKSVADIKKFEIKDEYEYLLTVPKAVTDTKVKRYLDKIRADIREEPENHRGLERRINSNPFWYVISNKKTGNVIFNYYMRNNVHFIHNPKRWLVADNFYCLNITECLYENLSILNSSITRLALLVYGKSQGHGLSKIQLVQFNKLPVINAHKLPKEAKQRLGQLGKELSLSDRGSSEVIISEIDQILIKVLSDYEKKGLTREGVLKEITALRG